MFVMEKYHLGKKRVADQMGFSWSADDDILNEDLYEHQGIMEMDHLGKTKEAGQHHNPRFEQMVFSWSLEDILDEDLYKNQVEKIPLTFHSEAHYVGSFVYPLLEETRAELASTMETMYKAPYAELFSLNVAKGRGKFLYDVAVNNWRNRTSERGKEPYRTLPGDLLILADGKPESVPDLQREGRTWYFSMVYQISQDDDEEDSTSLRFKIIASQKIEFQDGMFVVYLTNITTNKRIWNSLHMHRNMNIIKEVLYTDSMVKECCNICPFDGNFSQEFDSDLFDKLNESQVGAIRAALSKTECCHGSFVEQIWGPPGTGKTTTVSVLLFILLQMNRRTLTCAPTNVAIVQVASCVLNLLKRSSNTRTESGEFFYCIGDVLLFGNKQRLKVGTEVEEIYLENRVKRLTECFGTLTGWQHCIRSMVDLLEDCVSKYHVYVENELFKEKQLAAENENQNQNETKATKSEVKSFIKFVRDSFGACVSPLRGCILTFLTHIPKSFLTERNFQTMVSLLDDLNIFKSLLFEERLVSEELERLFTSKPLQSDLDKSGDMSSINFVRAKSLSDLKALQKSLEGLDLPTALNIFAITDFCFKNASLIFCTTSTSFKLHDAKIKPLEILVIDEAAQLKEAESTIPLQLPGMKHAILIGDEKQLPAMVSSNICEEAGFGRSLFSRLSSLGHSKHLLDVQYRMHPSISSFPNWKFYQNHILDAENVTCKSYERRYLSGPMFGPYSFINVVGGREEKDDEERSRRNLVEVALVIKIVQNLYKAWENSKMKLTIGVVSPYAAQVVSIQDKLAKKYEKLDGFSVKVKTIDGFQGGEEDIIILSTVRSNSHGNVGFLSSPQRTNVALTRARHCLWILGNERTLTNSECEWNELVYDARNRNCLFDADADECLKSTIIAAKKELDQLDDLVHGNSVLFKHTKWKVLFSDDFRKSFGKLTFARLKKVVINLLLKLSGGWRPKNTSVDVCCEKSSQILKKFKVEGLYVVCSVDIIKEVKYIQVLKVWDILPLEEIPKLTKRLEGIFSAYTDDYISRCTAKSLEGDFEVPRSWPASQELIRFHTLNNCEGDSEAIVSAGDGRIYVENSKVSESLLLMKFYSLSSGVVSHLLSGKELDLPMQVTDEQMDIILFGKTSFIIGRSGTGKTTILTMKLFQNDHSYRVASEGVNEARSNQIKNVEDVNDSEGSKPGVLRQLFVTVSPKLCYAVKQHVSQLTSISCHGNSSAEINLEDADSTSEFNDIPNTFVNIPVKKYPLVLTFHKFLMMLDGTLGSSYFDRFPEARKGSQSSHISSGSVVLQTFIRLNEVTFDRFCSDYWPHFNSNLKKKLDPSQVFTEIISHIKGGLQAGEFSDGKLSFEGYSLLAESRSSTLTKQKRENIYSLFQAYEKMKTERGEFDMGDLVIDLHRRLKYVRYEGDHMDFVYIDEVQDLSMRQISLFKYICQNVDEGFIFAGDTAQTIARGIDFRFQDIRSLFYKEFLTSQRTGKQEKGIVSEIFQLKQNFRTHAGVLDLAQSVIDILYCYFSHSIDILEPETSLISGEAPVLLESGNDENAIVTIFGGSGSGAEVVGFGAEQVILVRDDSAKTEICEFIGKQALVLTIVECKGLEFQDVLLYNFFGTSPLKDQWRVIYEYMKERDWLDENLYPSFPSFCESRHSVLCSELKQLYVAITRTRQRLWICENKEELSKPMFEYWKRRGLVQIRKLDDSVAQAMRVASSPQEWRERGKKLFYEKNFVMATMCFERAGDTMWETLAKASGLRASGDQMRGTNPEAFISYVREAAGMFESVGKLESAALCFCDLGEYEKAGKINLNCGKMDAAAECFTLAGCYSDAAEAFAKGDKLSECLSVCRKGKLFDKGFQYIEQWKEHCNVQSKELEQIEQDFLESCASDYHERKDPKSMMKFVHAFRSMESKRKFLKSLGCLDDLLILEEESGNFLDAAELARSWGDVLKEANLLEKAGHFKDATVLLLWYVFFSSLWGNGNKGWPLKQFAENEELCEKAKSLAKIHSENFNEFVCSELEILSDQRSSLLDLKISLLVSQKNKSLRGEIFLFRKILDSHIRLNSSKYDWEDELPVDINKHCDDKTFRNQVSVRTLVYYWNAWKENVLDIFEVLESFHKEGPNEHEACVDFILNYFGVRKQCVKGNIVYILVNEHADWIRNDQKSVQKDGKLLIMNTKDLVFSMRSHWQSELVSVGINVLDTLEGLNKSKSTGSAFHRSTSLLHMFEVSKFLLDCQHVNPKDKRKLEKFLGVSSTYFDFVFPLDWRRAVCVDMISLRETDLSLNLLEEIILQNIKGGINYLAIGRVMMTCLGSRKPAALYEHITKRIQWNPAWKQCFEIFMNGGLKDVYESESLLRALDDTYRANWRCTGYMSPHSFVYLLESLLFMTSFHSRTFFTTKSSFVGWFTHIHSLSTYSAPQQIISNAINFIFEVIKQVIYNKTDTISWIEKWTTDYSHCHRLLSLKLVMMLSLICLQVPDCSQPPHFSQVLLDLLSGVNNIAYLLPKKFVYLLLRRRNGYFLNLNPELVAEAFMSIEDSLLIVLTGNASPRIRASSAVFVDLRKSKQKIMSELFPRKTVPCVQKSSNETSSSNTLPDDNLNVDPVEVQLNWQVLEDITEAINGKQEVAPNMLSAADMIKKALDQNVSTLSTALADEQFCAGKDASVVREANLAYDDLKLLSSAFGPSQKDVKHSVLIKIVQGVAERLRINRPTVDDFLKRPVMNEESKIEQMVVSESSSKTHVGQTSEEKNDVKGKGVAVENQTGGGNTQDGKNKKGKGKNKNKKGRKGKK
ncbi:putative TPR and ankyrin repeat-containing protein [Helianthus annuus]|nr:putative TPR and ankyrin repeat-containing protein [Helianthus annuus]